MKTLMHFQNNMNNLFIQKEEFEVSESAVESSEAEKSATEKLIEAEVKQVKTDISRKSDKEKAVFVKELTNKNPALLEKTTELGGVWAKLMEIIQKLFDGFDDEEEEEKDKVTKTEEEAQNEVITEKGKLDQQKAFSMLSSNFTVKSSARGIITKDSPTGSRREKMNTTLEGIRPRTISGINYFQKSLGIPLVITGGTEDGHGGGLRNSGLTHGNGYKLDIGFGDGAEGAIEDFLKKSDNVEISNKPAWDAQKRGNPNLKYTQYEVSMGGYKYKVLKESDHFDICVT